MITTDVKRDLEGIIQIMPPEMNNFFLSLRFTKGKEKIVVGLGEEEWHYTLHFGTRSGWCDLHKTNELTGEHITLFKIRHFSLLRMVARYRAFALSAIGRYWGQKINIGKLKRHECLLILMTPPEEKWEEYIRVTKRGKHVKMREAISESEIYNNVLLPEEVMSGNVGMYQVYSSKRGKLKLKGFAVPRLRNPQSRQLVWINKRDYNQYHKFCMLSVYKVLQKASFENKQEVLIQLADRIEQRYSNVGLR